MKFIEINYCKFSSPLLWLLYIISVGFENDKYTIMIDYGFELVKWSVSFIRDLKHVRR